MVPFLVGEKHEEEKKSSVCSSSGKLQLAYMIIQSLSTANMPLTAKNNNK